MSADPALGDYLPVAPFSDEAREHNRKLPGQGGVFNPVNLALYHYAGNNPLKYVDPNGEELTIKFYVIEIEKTEKGSTAKGFLMVTDNDTGSQELYITVWSGGIDHGEPIPFGKYDILEKTEIGYRLEAKDNKYGDDKVTFKGQKKHSNLRLHRKGSGFTFGCISVREDKEWKELDKMLKSTEIKEKKLVKKDYKNPFKENPLKENNKYGELEVIDARSKVPQNKEINK